MRTISHIVLHHNGVPGRTIHDIRRTHVEGNGWIDVGYHVVVHEDGTAHRGRPNRTPGAHVAGFNATTLGICYIGNGNVRGPNLAQMVTIFKWLERWCRAYGLPASAVLGHRETGPFVEPPAKPTTKACPGNRVDMEHIRAHLARALARPKLDFRTGTPV